MSRTAFGQLRPYLCTIVDGDQDGGGTSGNQSAAGQQAGQHQADTQQEQQAGQQKIEDLPDWAQKQIADLRRENGAARTTAKQQAADQARADLAQTIGKALGLVKDEQLDPAKLTEQLTTAQQAQRDTAIQLAVYRAAGQHKGNPDALLDSKAFLANVSTLDPTSSDFPTKVSDAVKTAVGSHPSLRLVQATGSSAADHAGGSGETGAISEQQLASMTPEQIDKAYREGRLKHLL